MNSSKAAVCIVDLTKKDDNDAIADLSSRKVYQFEEKDIIKENEEEEGSHLKNLPNTTS